MLEETVYGETNGTRWRANTRTESKGTEEQERRNFSEIPDALTTQDQNSMGGTIRLPFITHLL